MKFVHMADMHFDTSFSQINDPNLGTLRRIDQRKAFTKIIDYIIENNVDYFFISGDFYEHSYIRETTIDFINSEFERIKNTKVFITPGNHDPFIKNSYYNKYKWAQNVKIFGGNVEKVELPDMDLYGFGFDDFYMRESKIDGISIQNKEKVNVLIMHGSLDGGYDDERMYNPMSTGRVKELGFDYVALGHIHKRNLSDENQSIVYPGSTIAIGFDEPGSHGIIAGEFIDKKLSVQYIPIDESEFVVLDVSVSDLSSMDDLVQKLLSMNFSDKNFYEVNLVGNRTFEIDMYNLKKMVNSERIIKFKNSTKIGYDIEKLANESTLRGLYVKELMERIETADEKEKKVLEEALEVGLEILDK